MNDLLDGEPTFVKPSSYTKVGPPSVVSSRVRCESKKRAERKHATEATSSEDNIQPSLRLVSERRRWFMTASENYRIGTIFVYDA